MAGTRPDRLKRRLGAADRVHTLAPSDPSKTESVA